MNCKAKPKEGKTKTANEKSYGMIKFGQQPCGFVPNGIDSDLLPASFDECQKTQTQLSLE